jgi:hypothetical protein
MEGGELFARISQRNTPFTEQGKDIKFFKIFLLIIMLI